MVRPEQLLITTAADAESTCEVVDREFYGHDAIVRLRITDDNDAPLVVRIRGDAEFSRGAKVKVTVVGPVTAWDDAQSFGSPQP
jgi:ABC-type sugar transport system ATPase subunit